MPETVLSKTPFSSPWVSSLLSGTYVVGVISGDSGAHGAVAYYSMSSNAMAYLRQQLFSTTAYMGQIQDISTDLLKALVDPFQYITSAMWFPCDPGGTVVSTMSIGWWDVDMTGKGVKRVENFIYLTSSRSISVKANPTAISQGGDYRYSSPYSSYSVFLPPFGEIVLSASVLSNFIFDAPQIAVPSCTVNYQVAVDVITGLGHVIFTIDTAGSDNIIIAEAESQVGVPTSIAQNSGTSIQAVAGYVGKTLGGDSMLYAGLGALATKMVNTAFPVLSASGAFEPTVKSKFDNGALVKYQMACYIQTQYRPTVDENIDKFGRPLYATRTVSTLGKTEYSSGYIKTINADIDIAGATITEQESIKEIMNGGFFYE